MKLQIQPERWQCAVTAFAMALDVSVADLIRNVGHDGRGIIFPDLPEPRNHHGHSIYELIWAAIDLGYAVTPIPLRPGIRPASDPMREFVIGTDAENYQRFRNHIHGSAGVMECYGPKGHHVVAYDHGRIYDPRGYEFPYLREVCEERNLYTYCLWRVDRIRNICLRIIPK